MTVSVTPPAMRFCSTCRAGLSTGIRAGDTAARLGGDEFAILLEDLADPAAARVRRGGIRERFRAPFSVAGRTLAVSATIGVATSSGGGAATDVVRNADAALYVGKADGKDRHAVFSEHMHATAIERLTLEQDLRAGIGRGELVLVYQPKVDGANRAHGGRRGTRPVESSAPWTGRSRSVHPHRGAERAHQRPRHLGADGACRQAQAWATSAVGAVPVAVNVSGRNLVSCGLIDRVLAALKQTGLDPRLLELEITESAAIPQQGEALDLLQEHPRPGRAHRDRRLRHRVLGAQPAAGIPRGHAQDRPVVRALDRLRACQRTDRRRDDRDGAQPRAEDRGRRGRDRGAARATW